MFEPTGLTEAFQARRDKRRPRFDDLLPLRKEP